METAGAATVTARRARPPAEAAGAAAGSSSSCTKRLLVAFSGESLCNRGPGGPPGTPSGGNTGTAGLRRGYFHIVDIGRPQFAGFGRDPERLPFRGLLHPGSVLIATNVTDTRRLHRRDNPGQCVRDGDPRAGGNALSGERDLNRGLVWEPLGVFGARPAPSRARSRRGTGASTCRGGVPQDAVTPTITQVGDFVGRTNPAEDRLHLIDNVTNS